MNVVEEMESYLVKHGPTVAAFIMERIRNELGLEVLKKN